MNFQRRILRIIDRLIPSTQGHRHTRKYTWPKQYRQVEGYHSHIEHTNGEDANATECVVLNSPCNCKESVIAIAKTDLKQ